MSHLKGSPIFTGMTEAEIEALLDAGSLRDLAPKELLFRQGDSSEHVYIVRRGYIRISATNDGEEEIYATLPLGAVFGEIGVVGAKPRTANAMALGPTSVLEYDGETFTRFVDEHPVISQTIRKTMMGRFRNDERRAERRKARIHGAKVFPVFSGTGGAGTTFLTANLAAQVKELTKQRILVIDADLMFGDQETLFGVPRGPSLTDVALQPQIGPEDVRALVRSTSAGVDLICAPHLPEEAEFVTSELLGACLDHLLVDYDYIFCDTSRNLDTVALDLFERAAAPIYVLTPEVPSVRNALRWMDVIGRIGLSLDTTQLLLNQVSTTDKDSVEYVKERFGEKLTDELPEDYVAARASVNAGQLMGEKSPQSALTEALRRVAGRLVGIEVASVDTAPSFFNLWM